MSGLVRQSHTLCAIGTFIVLMTSCNAITGLDGDVTLGNPSSAGGTGGAGGGSITCTDVADCPVPGNECQSAICLGSECGTLPNAAGNDVVQQQE